MLIFASCLAYMRHQNQVSRLLMASGRPALMRIRPVGGAMRPAMGGKRLRPGSLDGLFVDIPAGHRADHPVRLAAKHLECRRTFSRAQLHGARQERIAGGRHGFHIRGAGHPPQLTPATCHLKNERRQPVFRQFGQRGATGCRTKGAQSLHRDIQSVTTRSAIPTPLFPCRRLP